MRLQVVANFGLQSTCRLLFKQLADEASLCCREGEECGVSHEGCGDQQERCVQDLSQTHSLQRLCSGSDVSGKQLRSSVLDACSVELLAEASIHCSDISCNRAMPATWCRKMLWPTCCSCAAAAKAGVYAINCPEWMLVLQACNRSSVYCGESASTWQPIQLLRPVAQQ